MTSSDQQRYLERICFNGPLATDVDTLGRLQKAHVLNVPFENLDIHRGVKIVLDINGLFQKVVVNRRGGFCYELNGLYFQLLTSIGFDVKMIAARVYNREGVLGPAFDHLALLVKIDGEEYLTDVGFGEFTFGPLKFSLDRNIRDERGMFFFESFCENGFRVCKNEEGKVARQYTFEDRSYNLTDYEPMCKYHQTSPSSHFTQKKFISIPTEMGRITLYQDKLTIKENGGTVNRDVPNEQIFDRLLDQYFAISLD